MPKARAWPNHAEDLRRDYIALALDIQWLTHELFAALISHNIEEVAAINQTIHRKATLQQELMIRAHKEDA